MTEYRTLEVAPRLPDTTDVETAYAKDEVMKYAIISDIHANLKPSKRCWQTPSLRLIASSASAILWATMPILRNVCSWCSVCALVIAGNHDQAAVGLRPYDDFNEYASTAIDWTRQHLTPPHSTICAACRLPRHSAQVGWQPMARRDTPTNIWSMLKTFN